MPYVDSDSYENRDERYFHLGEPKSPVEEMGALGVLKATWGFRRWVRKEKGWRVPESFLRTYINMRKHHANIFLEK